MITFCDTTLNFYPLDVKEVCSTHFSLFTLSALNLKLIISSIY